MVLISSISSHIQRCSLILALALAALCFGFTDSPETDPKLLNRIEKRCTKLFDAHINLELIEHNFNFPENLGKIHAIYSVSTDSNKLGTVAYMEVLTCHFGGCTNDKNNIDNTVREKLESLIILDSNHEIIQIDIIDFESNYGYEISAKWWLKQFYNNKPGAFSMHDNIDGISGATISCNQYIDAINRLAAIMSSPANQ